jgi:hypothetical protein
MLPKRQVKSCNQTKSDARLPQLVKAKISHNVAAWLRKDIFGTIQPSLNKLIDIWRYSSVVE